VKPSCLFNHYTSIDGGEFHLRGHKKKPIEPQRRRRRRGNAEKRKENLVSPSLHSLRSLRLCGSIGLVLPGFFLSRLIAWSREEDLGDNALAVRAAAEGDEFAAQIVRDGNTAEPIRDLVKKGVIRLAGE